MKFYVGQRVKLVSRGVGATASTCVGDVGRITSIGPFKAGQLSWDGLPFRGDRDVTVTWDRTNEDSATMFFRIVPITDPGRQVVSWEGSIWMPEHMRETAPESEGVKA